MTCCEVRLPRSDGGLRLMNSRPLLTVALKPSADRRPDVGHRRIGQHDLGGALLQLLHRLERDFRRGAGAAEDQPGVVLRKEALGCLDVRPTVSAMVARNTSSVKTR